MFFFLLLCARHLLFYHNPVHWWTKVQSTGLKRGQLQHSLSQTMLSNLEFTAAWLSGEPLWEELMVVPDWLWRSSSGRCNLSWDASPKICGHSGTFSPTNHSVGGSFLHLPTAWHPGQTAAVWDQGQFYDPYLQQDVGSLPKTLGWWIPIVPVRRPYFFHPFFTAYLVFVFFVISLY